jgi:hypothetical protein
MIMSSSYRNSFVKQVPELDSGVKESSLSIPYSLFKKRFLRVLRTWTPFT